LCLLKSVTFALGLAELSAAVELNSRWSNASRLSLKAPCPFQGELVYLAVAWLALSACAPAGVLLLVLLLTAVSVLQGQHVIVSPVSLEVHISSRSTVELSVAGCHISQAVTAGGSRAGNHHPAERALHFHDDQPAARGSDLFST